MGNAMTQLARALDARHAVSTTSSRAKAAEALRYFVEGSSVRAGTSRHIAPRLTGSTTDKHKEKKQMAMVERNNVEFGVEGGVTLRGWLFVPGAKGPAPAITMAHGYAGVKEHGLERFARAFAEAGFVVLVHDHRNFGASDGEERGDVDPWQQIADWRRAISFLERRPEVDAAQIGIWGTSYAGGHAIVLVLPTGD